MVEHEHVARKISGAKMRLRQDSPFFGVLALHAEFIEDSSIPTAATDGMRIFYNPEFMDGLSRAELAGVLLHEVLHCAFAHIPRRRTRDPRKWNVAADYVINPIVKQQANADLPDFALLDEQYEGKRVEEVYDMLPEPEVIEIELPAEWFDLQPEEGDGNSDGDGDSEGQGSDQGSDEGDQDQEGGSNKGEGAQAGQDKEDQATGAGGSGDEPQDAQDGGQDPKKGAPKKPADIERYWRNAVTNAVQVHRTTGKNQGRLPQGAELLVREMEEPEVDWRDLLWQYTVKNPTNYENFDRRHIHAGLYLEELDGEKLEVHVGIDTSGSCVEWVTPFMSELQGILNAFPHVRANVSYIDAAMYGPYEIDSIGDIPTPQGGGGTSFKPLFDHLEEESNPFEHHIVIYLTDGYGSFPEEEPRYETIWVIPPGGANNDEFPFGTCIRLQKDHR